MDILYEQFPRIVKYIASAQEFTTNTITQIDDWVFPVKTGEVWRFYLSAQFGVANTSNDCAFRINAPSGTSGTYGSITPETAQSNVHDYNTNTGALGMTTGSDTIILTGSMIVGADGDVVFFSRLNTGSGSGLLELSVGSHIIFERIA